MDGPRSVELNPTLKLNQHPGVKNNKGLLMLSNETTAIPLQERSLEKTLGQAEDHHVIDFAESKPNDLQHYLLSLYLPIIRIVNEPGTAVPWPPRPPPGGGGGAGPRSCDIVKRWPVLLSNVTVRAPFIV